jgi:cytochrome c peroxidase
MRKVEWRRRAITALAGILISSLASASSSSAQSVDALKAKYKRPEFIPFPSSNPYTPEKAALGKMLYFDPRLSGADNITCASCHNPSFGWEAPVALVVGAQNTRLARHSPTVLNHAWGDRFFWDGRAATLEEQAKGPIEADVEMNMPLTKLTGKLKAVPDYVAWFEKVFPKEGITADSIAKAIATYERTVVSSHAPFDAWVEGDEKAISESAKRGFALFNGKARCADCHTGWNFTDNKFHDIGLTTDDIGRGKYEASNQKARHAFKTPSLRDTAQRPPFMHNGSVPDLDSVIVHYVSGGVERPSRSPLMQPVPMSETEIADLKAFLATLTGSKAQVPLPILPN